MAGGKWAHSAVSFSVLQFGSQRKILLPFPFAGIIGEKKSTEIQINLICYPLPRTLWQICSLENMAEYMCFKISLGSETCIRSVRSLCTNSRESQQARWHRKMLPDKRWFCYFYVFFTKKKHPIWRWASKHAEAVCGCGWKAETQSHLSTWCVLAVPPLGLCKPPPGPAAWPACSQVTGLPTAAFRGMSLPHCGCAEHFS